MSRIGKKPIPVPAGVDVTIDGTNVTVKGPKGELSKSFYEYLTISREGDEIVVTRPDDSRTSRAMHGLTRTLIHNMVVGVSDRLLQEARARRASATASRSRARTSSCRSASRTP